MSKRKCPSSWQLPGYGNSVPYVKGDVFYVNGKPFGPVDLNDPFQRQYINVPGSSTKFEEKYIIPSKRIRITSDEDAENIAPVDPLNILVKSETSTYCISRKVIKTENDISVIASSSNTVNVKTEVDANTGVEAEVEPPSHSRVSLEDCNNSSNSGGIPLSQVHSDVVILDDEVSIPCDDIIINSPNEPNDVTPSRRRHRSHQYRPNVSETPNRRHGHRSVLPSPSRGIYCPNCNKHNALRYFTYLTDALFENMCQQTFDRLERHNEDANLEIGRLRSYMNLLKARGMFVSPYNAPNTNSQ